MKKYAKNLVLQAHLMALRPLWRAISPIWSPSIQQKIENLKQNPFWLMMSETMAKIFRILSILNSTGFILNKKLLTIEFEGTNYKRNFFSNVQNQQIVQLIWAYLQALSQLDQSKDKPFKGFFRHQHQQKVQEKIYARKIATFSVTSPSSHLLCCRIVRLDDLPPNNLTLLTGNLQLSLLAELTLPFVSDGLVLLSSINEQPFDGQLTVDFISKTVAKMQTFLSNIFVIDEKKPKSLPLIERIKPEDPDLPILADRPNLLLLGQFRDHCQLTEIIDAAQQDFLVIASVKNRALDSIDLYSQLLQEGLPPELLSYYLCFLVSMLKISSHEDCSKESYDPTKHVLWPTLSNYLQPQLECCLDRQSCRTGLTMPFLLVEMINHQQLQTIPLSDWHDSLFPDIHAQLRKNGHRLFFDQAIEAIKDGHLSLNDLQELKIRLP